jgi:hypothetical protein
MQKLNGRCPHGFVVLSWCEKCCPPRPWIPKELICQCLRCGHTWVKRISTQPKRCPSPKCKSRYWATRKGIKARYSAQRWPRGSPRRRVYLKSSGLRQIAATALETAGKAI